jgi:hypothetical protein
MKYPEVVLFCHSVKLVEESCEILSASADLPEVDAYTQDDKNMHIGNSNNL